MHSRILDLDAAMKPLDFGGYGYCGSVDKYGRLFSLSCFNSEDGMAGFSSAPPLANAQRDDNAAVRRYRHQLSDIDGFGPIFEEEPVRRVARLIGDAIPELELHFSGGRKAVMTILTCETGVLQRWRFQGFMPSWGGPVSVQRAVYPLLPVSLDLSEHTHGPTEERPEEDVVVNNHVQLSDGRLRIQNTGPKCTIVIDGLPSVTEPVECFADRPTDLRLPRHQDQTVILSCALAEDGDLADHQASKLRVLRDPVTFDALLAQETQRWTLMLKSAPQDPLVRRALVYGTHCAIPTGPDASCLITDHMILSLSWTRDAWYTAKMFLEAGEAFWPIVRRHLIWLFEVADRDEEGCWGRAHFANGAVKDRNFQLDQQLFPLLELAEYVERTNDRELFDRLSGEIAKVVEAVLARKHKTAFLFPTDETPADDPLDYKYHFSSHVLMVHTFRTLECVLPNAGYLDLAETVRADTIKHFSAEHDGQQIFSYATDAEGSHLFYHDANDTPLALAPEWGVIDDKDPVWRATIDFAFSPDSNPRGCFGNARLGSVHTPAPWPLGDLQKLILARRLGRPEWATQALHDLSRSAQWDGALPEAYNADDFSVASRQWFAWPNSLYAITMMSEPEELALAG